MSMLSEFRAALLLGTGRTLVRGLAASGDPVARLLGVKPLADPYPSYERVRARGELMRSKLGFYATASHPLTEAVLRDPRFGVIASGDFVRVDWTQSPQDEHTLAHPVEHSLLALDPPEHSRLRKLATPAFTPRRLRARAPQIERTVTDFLDAIEERGEVDLIREFAVGVPVKVICDLLGIPEANQASFVAWGHVLGGTLDGARTMTERHQVRRAVVEMGEFFDELIARRRRQPGDDVLTELINAEPDGAPLTRKELVATAGLLLGAGFETTVNLIGNGVLALLAHPEHKRELIERSDYAPLVIEEVLRYDPPVQHTGRIANEDVTIGGVHFPKGSAVVLLLAGANRDPMVFSDPGRFDPRRENNRDHLAFSSGVHYCLGANLARMEGEIALRRLFTRFPDLRVCGASRRNPARTLRGVANLPVDLGSTLRSVPV
ncbi:MAG: cytochrome P450 [Sciscionella sp.]